MEEPSGSAGNQLSGVMAPAIPPVGKLPGSAPPVVAGREISTLRYHLLWEGHQLGVTNRAVSSGKSTSRPPGAAGFTMRPPSPRSSPGGLSVFRPPATRSLNPPESRTPLNF